MSETTQFTIGSEVAGSDGVCGDLRRVVIDPVARALTHLVVQPRHGRGVAHLVPIALVASAATQIRLRCTTAEFEALAAAEETHFLPGASGEWSYGKGDALLALLPGHERHGPGCCSPGVRGCWRPSDHPRRCAGGRGGGAPRRTRPCHGRGHRTGPRARDRSPRSPRDTRSPRGGPPLGPQAGRHSDQRRDGREGRRPSQPQQGPGARPASDRPRSPR